MIDDLQGIAEAFDARAGNYSKNEWHRHYAEALVELASLQPGQRVLDAGTGTGFAALAIARAVGPSGRVSGVDVSPEMLAKARQALDAAAQYAVELFHANAADLPSFPDASFDAVICSAALLYMPVDQALREWHRLLADGGLVGFSTMQTGSPEAGRLFRDCAGQFGLTLEDPSAPLGSEALCRRALESAGFHAVSVVPGRIQLSAADLALAWESNLRSAKHAAVRALSPDDREAMRARYELALRTSQAEDPSFGNSRVLYAFARK